MLENCLLSFAGIWGQDLEAERGGPRGYFGHSAGEGDARQRRRVQECSRRTTEKAGGDQKEIEDPRLKVLENKEVKEKVEVKEKNG